MRIALIAACAILAVTSAGPASAEILHYAAKLSGGAETPPNASSGTGSASVDLDATAKTVSWTITYGGLSGPATAAHFHGPAPAGQAAGVEIPLKGDLASPITGSASVSDAQIADLRAGQWYVNVHTAAHPAGEIRGQIQPAN
jgi:hypothetical protein